MKVYIHTDLEGVSGIETFEMIQTNSPRFEESRLKLTSDVNAAVAGAFDGGAVEVTVLDSHGSGIDNIVWEKVDPRAQRDTKPTGKWWGILDESYDATFFIGAHAMAGTLDGFLDHTQSSTSIYNWYYNGRKFGELGQWAMVAGNFGVPLVMVAGDEAAVAEAKAFFSPIETAPVKRGVGRNRAECLEPDEAHRRIHDAAARALSLVGKAAAFEVDMPLEIVIDFCRSDFCDRAAGGEGVEQIDARRVRKIAQNRLDIFV